MGVMFTLPPAEAQGHLPPATQLSGEPGREASFSDLGVPWTTPESGVQPSDEQDTQTQGTWGSTPS